MLIKAIEGKCKGKVTATYSSWLVLLLNRFKIFVTIAIKRINLS